MTTTVIRCGWCFNEYPITDINNHGPHTCIIGGNNIEDRSAEALELWCTRFTESDEFRDLVEGLAEDLYAETYSGDESFDIDEDTILELETKAEERLVGDLIRRLTYIYKLKG